MDPISLHGPLEGFNVICLQILNLDSKVFFDLEDRENEGERIAARLFQLNLKNGEYRHLLRLRHLLDENTAVLEAEWKQAESILTKAYRRRNSAQWRDHEDELGIFINPDLFQLPTIEPEPFLNRARTML